MNYTIDDAQWATAALQLSPGWNMLRTGSPPEYINATQVASMTPLLSSFWNASISWTTMANASTTLSFQGSDIWAYGMSGPEQGQFTATLDGRVVGEYTAHDQTTDHHHLLFSAHGLSSTAHTLRLTNADEGSSLAFDVAYITPLRSSPESASSASATLPPPSATVSAASDLLPTSYTPAQLALLEAEYHFRWNGAAYFTVIFSALVLAFLSAFVAYLATQSCMAKRRKADAARALDEGESHLMTERIRRPRPTTRMLNALKGRKIGTPTQMGAEDGASAVARGSVASFGHKSDEGNPALW
ncbi:hypothetical protein P7C73_g5279, partial [Tremellales sp. Uapishka_1]